MPSNSTSRMEAFSDGVFSIASTLLVLEIALRPPTSRHAGLYSDEEPDEELQSDRRTIVGVGLGYVGAILVGLVFPTLAVFLYLALGVILVVPFRHLRMLLFSKQR